MPRKISLKQEEILLRRSRVIELRARGISERKMSEELGIPRSTLHTDLKALKRQAMININLFAEQELPHEMELMLENTNALLRVAWTALQKDVENNKPPYSGIESILSILSAKNELLGHKLEVVEIVKGTIVPLEDKQFMEAFEAEKHRREAIF